ASSGDGGVRGAPRRRPSGGRAFRFSGTATARSRSGGPLFHAKVVCCKMSRPTGAVTPDNEAAMPQTSRRTSVFTESVIREMTRVAQQYDAINLAQGFPDFDPPPELVQAAKDAMDSGRHQYAITWGSPEIRAALAAKLERFMGI